MGHTQPTGPLDLLATTTSSSSLMVSSQVGGEVMTTCFVIGGHLVTGVQFVQQIASMKDGLAVEHLQS